MSFGPDLGWQPRPTKGHGVTRRRVLKWVLVTAGVTGAGLVALIVFVLIQLEGGLPWAFTTAPKASDPQVVTAISAGNTARDHLVTTLSAAGVRAGLTPVATTLPKLSCTDGQHNWKINNNFDLQCSTSTTLVLGSELPFDSRIKTQLLTLNDQLTALRWQPKYGATTMTSLKDLVAQDTSPVTPNRSAPFLQESAHANYFHGEAGGGQGSATMDARFTADVLSYNVKQLNDPYATPAPTQDTPAYTNTKAYLDGHNRYVILVALTYQSFSG